MPDAAALESRAHPLGPRPTRFIHPLPLFLSLLSLLPVPTRAAVITLAALMFACAAPGAAKDLKLASVRVWPAQDYTRITLEAKTAVDSRLLTLKNPERLVLDLHRVELTPLLQRLAQQVGPNDPYIKTVRVGRFTGDTVRLVFDLKTEVAPQIFSLQPVKGRYGHRLVLDIYPAHPADPITALLSPRPATRVAVDSPIAAVQPAPASATPTPPAPPVAVPPPPPPAAPPTPDTAQALPPAAQTPERAPPPQADADASPPSAAPDTAKPARAGRNKPGTQRLIVVAIDAGHGGEDPGAHGQGGTYEKNVTLSIARRLKALVDDQPNMRGVLTRDGDYFVPLGERVNKARKVYADLFVSIHADSFIESRARGSSVFALSEHGASSSAARWLAKKENEADLIGGVNIDVKDMYLKMTLTDLSFTAQINDSLKLGKAVLAELGDINTLHKGEVEQAGFAVLKAPDIPSVLVETAFISNPDEEKKLKDDAYQQKMAVAILGGIKRYFAANPPLARSPLASN